MFPRPLCEYSSKVIHIKDLKSVKSNINQFFQCRAHNKLLIIHHKLLIIQPTSVASERAFSAAGLINTDRRNRMSPVSFRSNMLLNSWIKYLTTDRIITDLINVSNRFYGFHGCHGCVEVWF